eukprot:4473836-Ditylum_brightwellii.AAC.1
MRQMALPSTPLRSKAMAPLARSDQTLTSAAVKPYVVPQRWTMEWSVAVMVVERIMQALVAK